MSKSKPARRIVLTGVSRGLGRAMLAGFAARGHTVCGCARSAAAIDELRSQFGPPHMLDTVDVGSDEEVREWAGRLLGAGPAPDLVVNNAGLINRNAPLWKVPAEEFAEVLRVNVAGVANVIRHFLPAMIERGGSVIVNFSSYWGRSVAPEVAPYCATKWAVEGLTQALAEELPKGMAAVCVNPGVINTDMLRSCFGPEAASYHDAEAWARLAVPFLLDLGSKHNGEQMTVPGQ
jgi:NAD(P)-dependent dehydrogenase (short-subunit alcohol dehydrogenase family)